MIQRCDQSVSPAAIAPGERCRVTLTLWAKPDPQGATGIHLLCRLTDQFVLEKPETPSCGSCRILDGRTLEWSVPALGCAGPEQARLCCTLRHVGVQRGPLPLNQVLCYRDDQCRHPGFPCITVEVADRTPEEPCLPEGQTVELGPCEQGACIRPEVTAQGGGRLITVRPLLKAVCPGRRVALAALLTRINADGAEEKCGLQTVTVPAHAGPGCRDVPGPCIHFAVPAEGDSPLCAPVSFQVRLFANYLDTDFSGCWGTD